MPYIKNRRDILEVSPRSAENAGELNFAITSILNSYVHDHGPSYQVFNEIIGVLECAKLEYYRRVIGKYEDQKIRENGDVYPDWLLGKTGRQAMQDATPIGMAGVPLPKAEIVRIEEAQKRHPNNVQEFTEAEIFDLRASLLHREKGALS